MSEDNLDRIILLDRLPADASSKDFQELISGSLVDADRERFGENAAERITEAVLALAYFDPEEPFDVAAFESIANLTTEETQHTLDFAIQAGFLIKEGERFSISSQAQSTFLEILEK